MLFIFDDQILPKLVNIPAASSLLDIISSKALTGISICEQTQVLCSGLSCVFLCLVFDNSTEVSL